MDLKIILTETSNSQKTAKVFTDLDDLIIYYHSDLEYIKKFEEPMAKFYSCQFIYKDKSFKINWRLINSDEKTHKLISMLIFYMDYYAYDYHRAIFNEMLEEYSKLKIENSKSSCENINEYEKANEEK